jgi:hypothetical protein
MTDVIPRRGQTWQDSDWRRPLGVYRDLNARVRAALSKLQSTADDAALGNLTPVTVHQTGNSKRTDVPLSRGS